MFSISDVPSIGTARYDINEYVAGSVSTVYLASLTTIQSILDKDPSTLTSDDYNNFYSALNQLKTLAQKGASSSSDPNVPYYMSYDMVQNLNAVMHALEAANIPLTSSSSVDAVQSIKQAVTQWQDLQGFGIDSILTNALNVSTDGRSLQSMIELEYISSGNTMLFASLASMQAAIGATTDTLNTLNTLQVISNKITLSAVGSFNIPFQTYTDVPSSLLIKLATDPAYFVAGYGGSPGGYVSVGGVKYNRAFMDDLFTIGALNGSAYFKAGSNTPLNLSGSMLSAFLQKKSFITLLSSNFLNSLQGYSSFYKKVASYQFKQQIPVATATAADAATLKAAKSTLAANLAALNSANPTQSASIPNTLANFVFRVLQDLSTAFANSPGNDLAATQSWILDNQNATLGTQAAQSSGAIQTNLTQAITAAQSLNQTQQQNVQQAMFLFQEFYKSSSNLLQSINQMITRVAQGITQ